MLSSSCCCVSDLLVQLPRRVCYLHNTLMVCWPFLQLGVFFFCVCFCVSKIYFCSEGFNTSVIFCRTANLNVVSSASLPSLLVIAGFWALQPRWSAWTSLSLHTAFSFSSWENPLYLLWSFTVGAHFPGRTLDFQSLASSCSDSSAGIFLFSPVSWSLTDQLHIFVCIMLHADIVNKKKKKN